MNGIKIIALAPAAVILLHFCHKSKLLPPPTTGGNMVVLVGTGKNLSLPLLEKVNALELASEIGVKPAARQLNMCLRTLNRWRQKSTALIALSNQRNVDNTTRVRLPGGGRRSSIIAEYEQQLIAYFDERRSLEKKVNVEMLIVFLRNLDESLIDKDRVIVRTRIWRVLRRHQIVLRRTTHQAQRTRLNIEVINDWTSNIKEQMTIYDVDHAKLPISTKHRFISVRCAMLRSIGVENALFQCTNQIPASDAQQ